MNFDAEDSGIEISLLLENPANSRGFCFINFDYVYFFVFGTLASFYSYYCYYCCAKDY